MTSCKKRILQKQDSFFIIVYMEKGIVGIKFYRKRRFFVVAVLLAVCLLLSGCVGLSGGQSESEEQELSMETLGLTPDFNYERKAEKPAVQVDRLGYLPGSVKTAIFRGEELPDRFQVMEKDSGECVYEGDIWLAEDGEDGIFTGYGTFSGLREEGSYYIQCDQIGCSYYFDVNNNVYFETAAAYGEIMEQMQWEQVPRESVEICEAVSYLLAAYEMYPELFCEIWPSATPGNEETELNAGEFFRMLREKTDLLLALQDERTGGIYRSTAGNVSQQEDVQAAGEELSGEATAAFAGTMAKYGYLYQEYDWDYANICLKAAAKAWRFLNTAGQMEAAENAVATGRIYAAAELYRASNEGIYHNYMLQNREFIVTEKEDLYLLIGKVTYLSSRRSVDHELCTQIMAGLMKEAGKIAAQGKSELFLVEEKETEAMLWDMTVLALTNYAIMNHEYVTVIENQLHYLFGRNREAAYLLEAPGNAEAAELLLLFSVVEAERQIVEASETVEEAE